MSQNPTSALPQGFSIFQSALGAQLQFFPAVGTQELDDLLDLYLPGPLSASEKRATVALDFLEYTQLSGQTFKFYTVAAAASASPHTTSPATSVASSFNVSPLNATWDWSQTSRTASVSSRASSHRVTKTSPPTRTRTTDFSHIPGMKIMTKDGMDVTNSASRGSKTKEQRDHAHLMRIIKACDACRKKKIRCDPSHKKRGASQASTPAPATAAARTAQQPRLTPPPPPPSQPQSASVSPMSSIDFTLHDSSFSEFDPNFTFDNLESLDTSVDLWDEFLQFPPMDFSGDGGLDEFLDPAYLSSQPSLSDSSASGSVSPVYLPAPPGTAVDQFAEPQVRGPESAAVLPTVGGDDYEDFNLFSPGSTFSEDDRMLEVSSSTTSVRGLSTPDFGALSPAAENSIDSSAYESGVATNRQQTGSELDVIRPKDTSDGVLGTQASAELQTRTTTALERVLQLASQSEELAISTNANGQLVICCPPGTSLVTGIGRSTDSDGQNVSSSLARHSPSSDSSVVMDVTTSELQSAAVADLEMIKRRAKATQAEPVLTSAVVLQPQSLLSELREATSSVASVSCLLASLYKAVQQVAESPGYSCVVPTVGYGRSVLDASVVRLDSSVAAQGLRDTLQSSFSLDTSDDSQGVLATTVSTDGQLSADGDGVYTSVADTVTAMSSEAVVSIADTDAVTDQSVFSLAEEPAVSEHDSVYDQPTDESSIVGVGVSSSEEDVTTSREHGDERLSLAATQLSCAINESIASVLCSFVSTYARWHSDGHVASSSRPQSQAFGSSLVASVC